MTRSAVGADLFDRPRAKLQVVTHLCIHHDGCCKVGVCDDIVTDDVEDDASNYLSRCFCHIQNHNADRSDVALHSLKPR